MTRLALLLISPLVGAGCAHAARGRDCAGLTREQCLWKQAQRGDAPASPVSGDTSEPDGAEVAWESEGSWTRTEQMLGQAADWLSDGLGGEVISREATRWCAREPTVQDKGHGPSWVCHIDNPPRIGNREFTLEANADGVLAVAARDFDGPESREVVALALRRWRSWCVEGRFARVERFQDEEFHRCALPGGPLLLVGRFPQDLEADLWQVSLTIMGAG